MKLVDLNLSIPAQVWAVLHALDADFEHEESNGRSVWSSTRAFYLPEGRVKGFLLSWFTGTSGALNVTITEAGGGDEICVIDWQSSTPCRTESERPRDARMAQFAFRDVANSADYVERLVEAFVGGKSTAAVCPNAARIE